MLEEADNLAEPAAAPILFTFKAHEADSVDATLPKESVCHLCARWRGFDEEANMVVGTDLDGDEVRIGNVPDR